MGVAVPTKTTTAMGGMVTARERFWSAVGQISQMHIIGALQNKRTNIMAQKKV